MLMSDNWIRKQCLRDFNLSPEDQISIGTRPLDWQPMIEPFVPDVVRERYQSVGHLDGPIEKVLSYGLSSYSYDVRLATKFKLFTNVFAGSIDPKQLDTKCYVEVQDDVVFIPPNGYMLGHTLETFRIPRDISALCVGKSTYARAGLMVNTTVIDAGFEGQIVLEAANCTNLPLKIYANEGFAQLLFFKGDQPCNVSYADRNGKYMHQTQIQDSKV